MVASLQPSTSPTDTHWGDEEGEMGRRRGRCEGGGGDAEMGRWGGGSGEVGRGKWGGGEGEVGRWGGGSGEVGRGEWGGGEGESGIWGRVWAPILNGVVKEVGITECFAIIPIK